MENGQANGAAEKVSRETFSTGWDRAGVLEAAGAPKKPWKVVARMPGGAERTFVVYAHDESGAREVFAFGLVGAGGVLTGKRVATAALEMPEEVLSVEPDPGVAPTPVVDERKAPGS